MIEAKPPNQRALEPRKRSIPVSDLTHVIFQPQSSLFLYNRAAADTAEHICSVRLSEVYERLGTEHKLDGDITDPQTWEDDPNQTKFVLGKLYMTNHIN